jgi:uncharacterized flavoprotein (TIGR03862 family)
MKSVAIIGSGPSALMAATVIADAGIQVTVFEKKSKPGLKLLIAGGSGLNVTNSAESSAFAAVYSGDVKFWTKLLKAFSPKDWLSFINSLDIKTFEGTSGRYFVEGMKALKLLRSWRERLQEKKVTWRLDSECTGFDKFANSEQWQLQFANNEAFVCDALCFCLGGASYEPEETPLRWPKIFIDKKLAFTDFTPSNVGYKVPWKKAFLAEAEGQPLKNIALTSSRGTRRGDAIITDYGIEGTPVYFVGEVGELTLDLKPDMTYEKILEKCFAVKENLSPMRRVKKQLNLCDASLALLFHEAPKSALKDLKLLVKTIKNFKIKFHAPQPIEEAISSAGGLNLKELNQDLMLNRFPGVFAAGEMLDWDAPTGGFLIQGCVSQGFTAGKGIVRYLNERI